MGWLNLRSLQSVNNMDIMVRFTSSASLPLTLLLLLLMSLSGSMSQQLCEHCNCQISPSKEGPRAIHSMSLVCNSGLVTWYGASGGVVLELSPFIHGNFRACFRTESDKHTHVKISQENSRISRRRNYRLKMDEAVKSFDLKHLHTSTERSKEVCVDSRRKEPILLYMEAERTPGFGGVSKVQFHYDMEDLDVHLPLNSMHDCRPCTKEEILDAYCSMDFVVVGSIAETDDTVPDSDKTHVSVDVKQVIHQSQSPHVFFQRAKRSDQYLTGSLVVPKKCRIQKDEGDFLLSGRVRLGQLSLKCAPYLHEWRQMQHEAECSHA